jgi:lipopolysaccharide heptosyltransferase I
MAERFLIVRLGALGDIIHAVPAVAALRRSFPRARIDWLYDRRHKEMLDLVSCIDRGIAIDLTSPPDLIRTVRQLRRIRYDAALDLQGLLKSAVLARLSGARRVIGFGRQHLREELARAFYTETSGPAASANPHIIQKNLSLLASLGVAATSVDFALATPHSGVVLEVRRRLGIQADAPFAVLNPGAAWPNKRWPASSFGEVAAALRDRHGLRSLVIWGPGEESIARAIVAASLGAAEVSTRTSIGELLQIVKAATVMVSGDTGPLHLAAASATPIVGIYGPTNPARNGPWSPYDLTVSRFERCQCRHLRRCRAPRWCLLDVTPAEVIELVDRRLAVGARG